MWKPRSSLRAVVAGLVAVGASVVLVPQAAANSFTETLGDATGETITVTYNDGDDQFCVNYAPSRVRGYYTVELRPDNPRRGPSHTFDVIQGKGTKCVSLARAYEDTPLLLQARQQLVGLRRNTLLFIVPYSEWSVSMSWADQSLC